MSQSSGVPWVIDPVMVSSAGDRLLDEDAVEALKQRLISKAALVTPNMAEAGVLTGISVTGADAMESAGRVILETGAAAVLVTGGDMDGDTVTDVLVTRDGGERFESPRIDTPHSHGTGCTLASAIATGLAQGLGLGESIIRARGYVREAIRTAPGFGAGHGPLNHAHTVEPFGGK